MRIPVKLISLDGRPPPGFDADGSGAVEAAPGATLADVLAGLGLPADEPYATLVNGEPVAAADRPKRRLDRGDSLTVFPPIKGGAGFGALNRGQWRAPDFRLPSPITPSGTGGLAMPKILDELRDDHKNMARLYDLLGRELKVFKNGELPDYDLVKKILDYCLAYPDQFHHPKEDLVFKKLRARDPATTDVIGDLAKEHEKLAAFTWRFSTALGNVLEDEQLPRDWFMDLANDFLGFSRRHMQMEEVLFFPAARKHLTRKDWADLEAAIDSDIDPAIDDDKAERYRASFQEIMAWGKTAEAPTGAPAP